MKKITYNICRFVNGAEILHRVVMDYSKINEEIAKREAYNGEYTIEDDGQAETYQPSIQEQLDAQAAAIMELMGVVYNG